MLARDYRTMTSGWQRAPYFRIFCRELVFKTGDFIKRKNEGGYYYYYYCYYYYFYYYYNSKSGTND